MLAIMPSLEGISAISIQHLELLIDWKAISCEQGDCPLKQEDVTINKGLFSLYCGDIALDVG